MNECLLVKRASENATLPSKATIMSVGYDLHASEDRIVQKCGGRNLIPTDLIVCIPFGHYGRIAPRSGLAWKNGIDVGAGVIDPDYRGLVGVILFNHSKEEDFIVKKGDRIAQLILERVSTPDVIEIKEVNETARGNCGFGSSGRK
jgi:dUTP pyrophosphatase